MMTSKGGPGRSEEHVHLIQSWRRLADQLGPLIGDSGFCALFGRACRVVAPEFRWLADTPTCKTRDAQIHALDDMLASVAPGMAQAANTALLQTFAGLLDALIGPALARRLLAAATGEEKNIQERQ